MNEKIDSLVGLYNNMVIRSKFEEGLFQLKNCSKTMSENLDYKFPANKEANAKKIQKKFESPPLTVLVSDLSLGTGWPFHRTTGQIGIQLLQIIRVKHITISHVSQSLAYDIWTAPQKFELWGVDHNSHEFQGTLLLYGTYEINGLDNVQEFSVEKTKSQIYSRVLLKIISNHGNPNLTCLYRVQVYGEWEDNQEGDNLDHFTPML